MFRFKVQGSTISSVSVSNDGPYSQPLGAHFPSLKWSYSLFFPNVRVMSLKKVNGEPFHKFSKTLIFGPRNENPPNFLAMGLIASRWRGPYRGPQVVGPYSRHLYPKLILFHISKDIP